MGFLRSDLKGSVRAACGEHVYLLQSLTYTEEVLIELVKDDIFSATATYFSFRTCLVEPQCQCSPFAKWFFMVIGPIHILASTPPMLADG